MALACRTPTGTPLTCWPRRRVPPDRTGRSLDGFGGRAASVRSLEEPAAALRTAGRVARYSACSRCAETPCRQRTSRAVEGDRRPTGLSRELQAVQSVRLLVVFGR